MNILAVAVLISLSFSTMMLVLDASYYQRKAMILLGKSVQEEYLIKGLLCYGYALYLKKGLILARNERCIYKPALPAQSFLSFDKRGGKVKITGRIVFEDKTVIKSKFFKSDD